MKIDYLDRLQLMFCTDLRVYILDLYLMVDSREMYISNRSYDKKQAEKKSGISHYANCGQIRKKDRIQVDERRLC